MGSRDPQAKLESKDLWVLQGQEEKWDLWEAMDWLELLGLWVPRAPVVPKGSKVLLVGLGWLVTKGPRALQVPRGSRESKDPREWMVAKENLDPISTHLLLTNHPRGCWGPQATSP